MEFVKKENLYTNGGLLINGKSGFKYADIIVGYDDEYYHAVFLKYQNYFTIMMNDYQTLPTTDIAIEVLTMLSDADMAGPLSEKPDKDKIKELLKKLSPSQNYYKVGNYIVRTGNETVPYKKATFLLSEGIYISNIKACITNMGTAIHVAIEGENKRKLDKYDELFSISVEGETVFRELICIKAAPDNDKVNLDFITEHEYYMKHYQMNCVKFSGDPFWAMQVMEYSINRGRDIPIEMRFDNQSMNTGKKRFFFLFSIRGLKIKRDVRFGLVTLSNESGISVDRENEFTSLLSDGNDCYAQIAVVNDSLRVAAEEASAMIDKVVSLLQVILLDDSSRGFFGTRETCKSWNFEVLNASIDINDHFYIEDIINIHQYAILSRTSSAITSSASIDEQTIDLLNKDNVLEDFFYLSKNKNAEDLLQAIVWLNASKKALGIKERVIALYNSVEFLVTDQKGNTLCQELQLLFGEEYTSSMVEIESSVAKIENVKLRERISGAIKTSFEGKSSVQSKLETLIVRLEVKLNNRDWELFDKLKKNRQKLIHNKKVSSPITNQELNELFHLVSKLIVHKIIAISEGGYND